MREGIHLTVTGFMEMDDEERKLWDRFPPKVRRKTLKEMEEQFMQMVKESGLSAFTLDVEVRIK